MNLVMLKLRDGPLLVVEAKKELDKDWMETRYYRPLTVYQEDGQYKIGTFVEVADEDEPFDFHNTMFECKPNADVVAAYTRHWENANISQS